MDGYVRSELVKLDILINKEEVDALSFIVHAQTAYERGLSCNNLAADGRLDRNLKKLSPVQCCAIICRSMRLSMISLTR